MLKTWKEEQKVSGMFGGHVPYSGGVDRHTIEMLQSIEDLNESVFVFISMIDY